MGSASALNFSGHENQNCQMIPTPLIVCSHTPTAAAITDFWVIAVIESNHITVIEIPLLLF